MNRISRLWPAATILLSVLFAIQQSEAAKSDPIGMVTGSNTGTYIQFGKNMSEIAKSDELNIWVKSSEGSIDNIKRMASNENAALGIVQSDVLGFLARSTNKDWQAISNRLRLVFPFYNEEVHLFAHKDIQRFEDLKGKRVVVGAENSGNWVTSTNLLHMTGVVPGERIHMPPAEGIMSVLTGEADAMFYVVGKPAGAFSNLQKMQDNPKFKLLLEKVHFVPLDHELMLTEYVSGELGPSVYKWMEKKVPTVSVKAVLVSFDFSSRHKQYYKQRCDQLELLGGVVRKNIDSLKINGHPKWKEVDLDQKVGTWKLDACSRGGFGAGGNGEDQMKKDLLCIITGDCE